MKGLKMLIPFLFLILFILDAPIESHAYVYQNFRKLGHPRLISESTDPQVSLSPSPLPAPSLDSGNAPSPRNPTAATTNETCDMVFHRCAVEDYGIVACVPFVGNGSQASYVLVQNVGDSSLQLNFTVLPYNISVEDIAISGHQVKKVKLPSNTGGSSSVLLKVGKGDCTIQLGASIPQPSYTSYLTPINGAYLFFVAVVFIGGTWSCCKFGKRVRHLKGVPYQELEMGQQDPEPTFTIEAPTGWDDNWDDDDWDEEKAVKSPGANGTAKNMEDEATLKYVDTTQWGNDWDD